MSAASDPAVGAVSPTPDALIRPAGIRGLYVGTGGNVAVEMSAGQTVTFVGVHLRVGIGL